MLSRRLHSSLPAERVALIVARKTSAPALFRTHTRVMCVCFVMLEEPIALLRAQRDETRRETLYCRVGERGRVRGGDFIRRERERAGK